VKKIFIDNFKRKPEEYFWSPGRVNIIGEHSDYHDGFVMPVAIDLGITWSVSKNGDNVRGYTEKFDEIGRFRIDAKDRTYFEWMLYLQGVVEVLKKRNKKFGGIDFAIHSTIPIGSGLSSSSSLATGFAYILNEIYKIGLGRKEIAKVACEAEWWYGTTGGIMDQYCIANGKAGNAVLLDCRKMTHVYVPIPKDIKMVIFETTIRHKQISSPFALRKKQAHEAVEVARQYFKDDKIKMLRDITKKMLEEIKPSIIKKFGKRKGEMIYRRSKHPIYERDRVLEMKEALMKDDLRKIGKILAECHKSLRDNYEVSCKELDIAVDISQGIKGYIGSRMIGGGFGGCTLNLVKRGQEHHFAGEMEEIFRKRTEIKGNSYICNSSDGVRKIPNNK